VRPVPRIQSEDDFSDVAAAVGADDEEDLSLPDLPPRRPLSPHRVPSDFDFEVRPRPSLDDALAGLPLDDDPNAFDDPHAFDEPTAGAEAEAEAYDGPHPFDDPNEFDDPDDFGPRRPMTPIAQPSDAPLDPVLPFVPPIGRPLIPRTTPPPLSRSARD